MNGDGIEDMLVSDAGTSSAAYIVFGVSGISRNDLNMSTLDGTNGFWLVDESVSLGRDLAMGSAGDVDGDGLADLVLGSQYTAGNVGRAYIIFARNVSESGQQWSAWLNILHDLNGTNGFFVEGPSSNSYLGSVVVGAGDVNNDGFADVFIGSGSGSGAWVVFGHSVPWETPFNVSQLDGTNGFHFPQIASESWGYSGGCAGDVNGDGIDDLIIGGSSAASSLGHVTGAVMLIFGHNGSWPAELDRTVSVGAVGFLIDGPSVFSGFGIASRGVGDVNGDGLADVVVGAQSYDPDAMGRAYGYAALVFGADDHCTVCSNTTSECLVCDDGFILRSGAICEALASSQAMAAVVVVETGGGGGSASEVAAEVAQLLGVDVGQISVVEITPGTFEVTVINEEVAQQLVTLITQTEQSLSPPPPPTNPAPAPPTLAAENDALRAEVAALRRRLSKVCADVFSALPATGAAFFERGRVLLHPLHIQQQRQRQQQQAQTQRPLLLRVEVRLSPAAEGVSEKKASAWVVAPGAAAVVARLPPAAVSVTDGGVLSAEIPFACYGADAAVLGDPSAALEWVVWANRSTAGAVGAFIEAIEAAAAAIAVAGGAAKEAAFAELQGRVQQALKTKAIRTVDDRDAAGRTLLHAACGTGSSALVTWLVSEKRASVDVRDREGWTPLFCALEGGFFATALFLLNECRAAVDTHAINGSTALHVLCMAPPRAVGFEAILERLLSAGVKIDEPRSTDGLTPLMIACRRCGSLERVELLLSHGAVPDKLSFAGDAAVHMAAENCSADVIDAFCQHGASGSLQSSSGKTPVEIAQERGTPGVAEVAKRLGARIEVLGEYELAWIFLHLPPSDIARARRACKLFQRIGGFVLGQDEYWRAQPISKDALMAAQKIRFQYGQHMDEWLAPVEPLSPSTGSRSEQIVLKVVVDGDTGTGRTTFVLTALGEPCDEAALSEPVDFRAVNKKLYGARFKLVVSARETLPRFRHAPAVSYRGASVVMICYSVASRASFENVRNWMGEVERFSRNAKAMVVATMIDVDPAHRQVTNEEGVALCEELGVMHIAVSAKTGTNVQLALKTAAEIALRDYFEQSGLRFPMLFQPQTGGGGSGRLGSASNKDCVVM